MNRDVIRDKSKILIIDDEKPILYDYLISNKYNATHLADIGPEQLHQIDQNNYSLIILDFGNVGKGLGQSEGLEILKHIKRCSPRTKVLAFTSRSLGSDMADFYREADGVLKKDAGLQDSLEKIDEMLARAFSVEDQWGEFMSILNIAKGSKEDTKIQDSLVRSLEKGNDNGFIKSISNIVKSDEAKKMFGKGLFELAKLAYSAKTGNPPPHGH